MNEKDIILILSGIVLILLILRKPIKKAISMSRGYRNNNPGNIRKTTTLWQGEISGSDPDFKTFVNMPFGYRALIALLKEYINKGYNTIYKIISRYAPSSENNTLNYIRIVENMTGIDRDKILNHKDDNTIKEIVKAISYVENGISANIIDIDKGFNIYYNG